jgi:hypothetical protein
MINSSKVKLNDGTANRRIARSNPVNDAVRTDEGFADLFSQAPDDRSWEDRHRLRLLIKENEKTREPDGSKKGRPGFNSSRSAKTYLGSSSSSFFTRLTSLENSSGSCFAKAS